MDGMTGVGGFKDESFLSDWSPGEHMEHKQAPKVKIYCTVCDSDTHHYQLLLQKPSKYGNSGKEKFKEFLDGFFSGVGGGPALASLELLDRHLICDVCGTREIVNEGQEFQ